MTAKSKPTRAQRNQIAAGAAAPRRRLCERVERWDDETERTEIYLHVLPGSVNQYYIPLSARPVQCSDFDHLDGALCRELAKYLIERVQAGEEIAIKHLNAKVEAAIRAEAKRVGVLISLRLLGFTPGGVNNENAVDSSTRILAKKFRSF